MGKATQYESWYGHNSAEVCEKQHYTIVDVPLFSSPEPVGEPVAHQAGYGDGDLWHAVAITEHGRIPGKACRGRICWYTYGGKEHEVTDNFEYLCAAVQ